MDASTLHPPLLGAARRCLGISYGFANQILFLVTVWYLFWFLRDGAITSVTSGTTVTASEGTLGWFWRDAGLAVLFALSHSVMLVPRSRRLLTRVIPAPFYDSTFCVVTCVSLLTLFFCWRQSETVIWEFTGGTERVIHLVFYASWGALLYSLALTGLGYQNGWTPFYYWLRRQKAPRREFNPHGAYHYLRHPVYLSFLGLVWFTPRMTLDHAVLTLVWTAYIFYGSVLKDRRLTFYIGKAYIDYQRSVPGYPLIPSGPLGRRRLDSDATQTAGPVPNAPPEVRAEGKAA